jgi:Protein of unknown function (DUF2459)
MAGRLISAWLVLMLLGGCAYRLTPPARVADPVTVYVVDYGRHASLALPLPDGTYVAWSWGDWRYFALGERSMWDGARALFASRGATLGRLSLARIEDAGGDLIPIRVERARAEALRLRLETRFRRREAEAVTGEDGRRFVPDGGGYRLGYTSAQRIADWLRELGVDARGGGPTAAFEVSGRRD